MATTTNGHSSKMAAHSYSTKGQNGNTSPSLSHGNLADQLNDLERRKYVKGAKLGSGQYADVFSAHLISDPTQLVAIKKIKVGPEVAEWGISHDSLREIKYLQELHHPNIIRLHAVFSTKNQNLNLVLEQLPQGDLLKLIQDVEHIHYGAPDIKAWMVMLCRAVHYCHANFVLHRDIKPNNLLIAANGEIKLADFGLARSFADPFVPMTYNTITKWYRPPELYYQANFYSGAVDVWSSACVFAELILRRPFLAAMPDTDMNMVGMISKMIGTPTEDNWPGVSKLKGYVPVEKADVVPVKTKAEWEGMFRSVGSSGVDMLMGMFKLDPKKRLTMDGVLRHEWWTTMPKPSRLEDLPKKGGGLETMGDDLKRRGGELPNGRGDKLARKLNFG
ncbi:serine/threonine-protein kinase-13 [Elsinoe australis]|uniref:Serine/threonine-protein kinase-13 n=1 Tax=Elsinoe australis TaxID=40998 RepID=A0A4U7B5Z9_9PEZI|nr:serine/threonine-protein kinase-13 [Elsinoe australis]